MINKTKLERLTTLMLSSVFSALNLSPRFHGSESIARALSAYYLGLSLRRVEDLFHIPRSTVQYYWRKLANYSPPPRVAVIMQLTRPGLEWLTVYFTGCGL